MLRIIFLCVFSTIILLCQLNSQELIDSAFLKQEVIIYFNSGMFDIEIKNEKILSGLVNTLKKENNFELRVHAHTDDVGPASLNKILSTKREHAIVNYFISQGVNQKKIKSNSFGETRRIKTGIDKKSRQLNRRASIQVFHKKRLVYLKGTLVDEETMKPINGSIQVNGLHFNDTTDTDKIGRFKVLAPLDKTVRIEAVAKGYFIASKTLKVTKEHLNANLKVPLPKTVVGKKFRFENMLFEGGRSKMLKQSTIALQHLKRFMLMDTSQCIEIAGHINMPGANRVALEDDNFKLSLARSLIVQNALIKEGTNPDRMLSRGYGNWDMVYPNARSPEHQRLNRRVEIIISSCDSTRLIQDQTLEDPERYYASPINRKYTEQLFEERTKDFPSQIIEKIYAKAQELKVQNIDPSQYTFAELLKMYDGMIKQE